MSDNLIADSRSGPVKSPALPSAATAKRLPGLDGLRALSIVLVLLVHGKDLPGFPGWNWLNAVSMRGGFGVDIFFVLSGFLITWLLLKEETRTGRIDMRGFYTRRALRILPPAFFYLAFVGILVLLHRSPTQWSEIAAAAMFFRNFVIHGTADVGHYWSLSIEEQFYLVWPLLLIILPRKKRLPATVALILAAPIWRRLNQHFYPGAWLNQARPDFRYDSLLMGCLLAMLRSNLKSAAVLRGKVLQSNLTPFVCVAAIALCLSSLGASLGERVGRAFPTIEFAAVALIINYVIEGRPGIINELLNLAPVIWLGQLSYSLYLWQQIFCYQPASLSTALIPAIVLSILGASVSYYVVEQPVLRWRQRWMGREKKIYPTVAPVAING
jgi:peptidoglycan/LPS O-acetylase OafA/YrhL